MPQQHFNVRIRAPQLVRCPTGKRIMNGRIDSEEKVLPFGHGLSEIPSRGLKLPVKVISLWYQFYSQNTDH